MTDPNIPTLIKELRAGLGLTQERFAQTVGAAYGSANPWENGTRRPQPFLVPRFLESKEELDAESKWPLKGKPSP